MEVKIVLSAYFKPSEDDGTRAGQLAWWCDELQDWTQEQVVWGLRQWNRDNPDKRPTPGHVLGLLTAMRGKREAARLAAIPKPQDPHRVTLSPEERAAIAADMGLPTFAPKAFPATGVTEK